MRDAMSMSELAGILRVRPPTASKTVARLSALGLVERRPHPRDRRLWVLFLTQAAHPLLERMRALGQEVREQALAGISDRDRDLLMRMLTHIKQNLSVPAETTDREARHG